MRKLVKVTSKAQIRIPIAIQKECKITEGMVLVLENISEDLITLRCIRDSEVNPLQSPLRSVNRSDDEASTLLREKNEDIGLQESKQNEETIFPTSGAPGAPISSSSSYIEATPNQITLDTRFPVNQTPVQIEQSPVRFHGKGVKGTGLRITIAPRSPIPPNTNVATE